MMVEEDGKVRTNLESSLPSEIIYYAYVSTYLVGGGVPKIGVSSI